MTYFSRFQLIISGWQISFLLEKLKNTILAMNWLKTATKARPSKPKRYLSSLMVDEHKQKLDNVYVSAQFEKYYWANFGVYFRLSHEIYSQSPLWVWWWLVQYDFFLYLSIWVKSQHFITIRKIAKKRSTFISGQYVVAILFWQKEASDHHVKFINPFKDRRAVHFIKKEGPAIVRCQKISDAGIACEEKRQEQR